MFNPSPAEKNRMEQRAVAPLAAYDSIKAKIDRGINRQSEGRKEVQDGLREMIQTKSYLKKYKTIAAFAENEYGKSRTWVYEQIMEAIPEQDDLSNGLSVMDKQKPSVRKADAVPDKQDKPTLAEVTTKEEEPEPPAVHSADEKASTPVKVELITPIPNPKDNGKPKSQLAVWREIEETLIGRSINRVDELNRQCPNPKLHGILIASLKECLDLLAKWRGEVK